MKPEHALVVAAVMGAAPIKIEDKLQGPESPVLKMDESPSVVEWPLGDYTNNFFHTPPPRGRSAFSKFIHGDLHKRGRK